MNLPRNFPKDSDHVGVVWYFIPLLWVAAAVAGLVIVTNYPALLDDPQAQEASTANALSVTPYAAGDTSVPAAASVFKDKPWEVSQHVDQF